MKIKQKKLLKQLKKNAEQYERDAKSYAQNREYEVALECVIISRFLTDNLIYGIETGYFFDETPAPKTPKTPKTKKAFVPPTREEVIQHAVETLPRRNPDWSPEQAYRCADNQFETYIDQDWHDGNGKKISNWKNKSITAMLYRKPHYFGSNRLEDLFDSPCKK